MKIIYNPAQFNGVTPVEPDHNYCDSSAAALQVPGVDGSYNANFYMLLWPNAIARSSIGLVRGATYYYVVSALSGAGESTN